MRNNYRNISWTSDWT